jgi:hypothetical protein
VTSLTTLDDLKGEENMVAIRSKSLAVIAVFFSLCTDVCLGQTMKVKIIKRQSNETEYKYVVPGHLNSSADTDVNCRMSDTTANCSGTTTTNGTFTSPREISYQVTGATFSLLLPDGRVAVVNCASKYKYEPSKGLLGPGLNGKRSCRIPIVDNIQVEFKGRDAKLMWPASVDGKKFESETYRILAVLDKLPATSDNGNFNQTH